jgi:SpoVK/Ycf46/Vps4 family AAA+-type ATPase
MQYRHDTQAPRAELEGDTARLGQPQNPSAMPLVLIITAPPASGKSTLGRQLAQRLGLPFLSKDLFKEVLFDVLGWSDLEWSQRLGRASMKLLFRSACRPPAGR